MNVQASPTLTESADCGLALIRRLGAAKSACKIKFTECL